MLHWPPTKKKQPNKHHGSQSNGLEKSKERHTGSHSLQLLADVVVSLILLRGHLALMLLSDLQKRHHDTCYRNLGQFFCESILLLSFKATVIILAVSPVSFAIRVKLQKKMETVSIQCPIDYVSSMRSDRS